MTTQTEIRIPILLLNAARSVSGYMEAHRLYRDKYNVNDRRAFEFLEADLEMYGLSGRYSEVKNFYTMRARYLKNKS